MPNWCYNVIKFNNKSIIDDIVKDGKVDFSVLVPEPDTPAGLDSKYLSNARKDEKGRWNSPKHIMVDEEKPWFNWYSWHHDFWGCKWNACNSKTSPRNVIDDGCEFDFDTPWVPPYKWIEALFSKYSNECIEIVTDWEDGCVTICKNDNGKLVEEDITPPEEDENE